MNINDEILSAFLDGELPEADMQAVRERLADDPALADRLAALSAVDDALDKHYSAIDERPLPQGVQQLLDVGDAESAPVIQFPLWRRAQQKLQQHATMAAGVALAIGFGLAHLTGDLAGTGEQQWQRVAQALETTPSGQALTLTNQQQLTPRISFRNQQGQYCRQYRLSNSERVSENIACRTGEDTGSWQQVASVQLPAQAEGDYQTASGGSLLDSTLDAMMAGDIVDPADEPQLINQQWQSHQ